MATCATVVQSYTELGLLRGKVLVLLPGQCATYRAYFPSQSGFTCSEWLCITVLVRTCWEPTAKTNPASSSPKLNLLTTEPPVCHCQAHSLAQKANGVALGMTAKSSCDVPRSPVFYYSGWALAPRPPSPGGWGGGGVSFLAQLQSS